MLIRVALCFLAMSQILVGCDSLSARKLANRCDSLFEDLGSELTEALVSFEDGMSPEAVIKRHTPRIRNIAKDVPPLRKDLARGGERNKWRWPDFVRSESILNYEATLGRAPLGLALNDLGKSAEDLQEEIMSHEVLPEALQSLGDVERNSFQDLKWFCNRVVAAEMSPIEADDDGALFLGFMRREMAANQLEILRAIETEEELEAFQAYLTSVGAGPR